MKGKTVVGTQKEPQVIYCTIILALIFWFSAYICVKDQWVRRWIKRQWIQRRVDGWGAWTMLLFIAHISLGLDTYMSLMHRNLLTKELIMSIINVWCFSILNIFVGLHCFFFLILILNNISVVFWRFRISYCSETRINLFQQSSY